MNRIFAFPSLLAVLLAGCASAPTNGNATEVIEEKESPAKKERELDALERKIGIARAKRVKVGLEQRCAEEQLATDVRHAKTEVEVAKASLARFLEVDVPNELASQELDLRTTTDRAKEAADELKQIEIMYKEQDLDDLTAEFVVSRGRRSAERAAARIAIQESKLNALRERTHPQKRIQLELALDKAMAGLKQTEQEGEIGRHGKAIALQEAENEIARLEHELVALGEEDKP